MVNTQLVTLWTECKSYFQLFSLLKVTLIFILLIFMSRKVLVAPMMTPVMSRKGWVDPCCSLLQGHHSPIHFNPAKIGQSQCDHVHRGARMRKEMRI